MARKKGAPRSRSVARDEDEDVQSTASSSTLASLGELPPEQLEDAAFERCIDDLYERRASTRERALRGLVALLSASYFHDMEERQGSLVGLLTGSARRGGANETSSAARALALICISLGAGSAAESLLSEAQPVLERAALHHAAAHAKAACIEALSIIAFVGVESPIETHDILATLSKLFSSASMAVAAAALRAWTLLFTTLPEHALEDSWREERLQALSTQLGRSDVEVRAAAGSAAALLLDGWGLAEPDGDPETDTESVASEGLSTASNMDAVVARMQDLATDKGDALRRSRKDRAKLRSLFRRLCSSIGNAEQNGSGSIKRRVKLRHGDTLVVDTLAGALQLDLLKRFLAEGFQIHLQENPFMHEVFDFQPRESRQQLSALDKRMYRSPGSVASKTRAVQRSHERAVSSAHKQAMLTCE